MYNKIHNNPDERLNVTYPFCYMDNVFSEEELDDMCSYFSSFDVTRATVVGPLSADNQSESFLKSVEKIRKSKLKFFNRDEENYRIFDRFNASIEDINERYYNFDLVGYEAFQYTEYHGDEGGLYNYHTDTVFGKNNQATRKLSVVMCLNRPGIDFDGGDFCINTSTENEELKIEMKRGRIIFFPSFLLHRVTPVTRGIRKSLVIWVTGPKFR